MRASVGYQLLTAFCQGSQGSLDIAMRCGDKVLVSDDQCAAPTTNARVRCCRDVMPVPVGLAALSLHLIAVEGLDHDRHLGWRRGPVGGPSAQMRTQPLLQPCMPRGIEIDVRHCMRRLEDPALRRSRFHSSSKSTKTHQWSTQSSRSPGWLQSSTRWTGPLVVEGCHGPAIGRAQQRPQQMLWGDL